MRYEAPKDTEVSTNVAGEEVRVSKWPADIVDEGLAQVFETQLVPNRRNPVHRAKKSKED